VSAARRSVDHTEQRTDGELLAEILPWVKLVPRPLVHADFTTFVAFPVPDQNRSARVLKVGLCQGERFADPEAGSPEHDDQRAKAQVVRPVARLAHYLNYFLDARWIGWIPVAPVTGRAPDMEARKSRW
jgi:hypothetical protein